MKLLKQLAFGRYVMANYKNFSESACAPLQNLLKEDSLKIKKGLELVPRPHFSYSFLIKIFLS